MFFNKPSNFKFNSEQKNPFEGFQCASNFKQDKSAAIQMREEQANSQDSMELNLTQLESLDKNLFSSEPVFNKFSVSQLYLYKYRVKITKEAMDLS
jgi:hypothetical protein